MSNFRIAALTLVTLFTLVACNDSKQKELIIGHWSGVEWLEEGQPSPLYNPADASFQFEAGGNYTFTYAGNAEKGKYFVTNHELYTTPDGGHKMMVRIVRLDQDTLCFDMNRGGTGERMTLVRK
jgi:hypothetical protein